MRKLLILLLFLAVRSSYALPAKDLWQKGNNFYQHKIYDSAAWCYEQLLHEQPRNAAVTYNLGNTYFRLNKIGPAVLYYQKTLYLQPGNTQAADNLALAESRITNRVASAPDIFFVKWWKSLTQASHANTWAIVTLFVFLGWIGLMTAKRFSLVQTIPPQLHVGLALILVLFLFISFVAAGNKLDSGMAVVMQNDTPFMANPQSAGKPQSLVPEGTTIKTRGSKGDWAQVQLPDGRTGWIQESRLAKI